MLKKFLLTAAAGATVFGVTAASAAGLNVFGDTAYGQAIAQQSSAISSVCDSNGVEPFIQVANGEAGAFATAVNFNTAEINPSCNGTEAQVVMVLTDGTVVYSEQERIGGALGARVNDLNLTLPAGVRADEIATTTVTFADEINGLTSVATDAAGDVINLPTGL